MQVAKSFFTNLLGVFHRRGAENAEGAQRGIGKRLLIPSLRSLCVLCASAVNSSAVLLALLSFQLWPFSVKEFLANYLGPLSPGDLNPRATANIGHNLISGHSQYN